MIQVQLFKTCEQFITVVILHIMWSAMINMLPDCRTDQLNLVAEAKFSF